MEGFLDPQDLQTKYVKLASEYSKLRAQIKVLKKAVTDEQSLSTALKEDLKLKDQQLRVAESESDSLSFRNQQLTCRVTILQQELESSNISNKKGVSTDFQGPQFLQNFDEEFSKKVAENATLIFTLNEYKERHEFEIKALKDEIDQLKSQLPCGTNDNKTPDQLPSESLKKTTASKNLVGETIKIALEKQLFETQHTLQETIVERDRLKNKMRLYEENIKNGSSSHESFNQNSSGSLSELNCILSKNELSEVPSNHIEPPSFNAESGTINYIPPAEVRAREESIKRGYQHRIDKLISDIAFYKSKAETFEQECLNMKNRLESEVQNNKTLQNELSEEKNVMFQTKEELSTTAANYENQLSAMSDHVAELNDVITKQKEQIESLQYQLLGLA